MIESAWLFIGAIAFAWTIVTVIGAERADGEAGDGLATVAGVVGFILWGVWSYGALEITVISHGSELTYTHPELVLLGVAMSLVPGYIALTGPIELIARYREPAAKEL